jgi:hypothetical protein
MDILKRLVRIVRAKAAGIHHRARPAFRQSAKTAESFSEPDPGPAEASPFPRQVIEDLAVFNLKPPSSLEEVKRMRNLEMKTYHADRFYNDPERFQTAQEIMQIYNAAYERLKAYYGKTTFSNG